jgi:steroid delta-isomerase-like uncharacterized protein
MTTDDIRSILERFRHAWEAQDIKALGACYADDCIVVSPLFNTLNGRNAVEKSFTDLFKVFETQQVAVQDMVIGNEEPPRAVVLWKLQSTHVGEVFGIPGSGKRIERTIAYILTFRDGLITRETRIYDFTSMLMQVGALKAKPVHG